MRKSKSKALGSGERPREVLPFRCEGAEAKPSQPPLGSTQDVLAAFANVSRRIEDLARELKCLGHFGDESNDRPRAA